MVKEVADITIKLNELEEVEFDAITEYLEDRGIKYQIIGFDNEQTIDTRSEDDKWFDYDMQKGFDKARGEL